MSQPLQNNSGRKSFNTADEAGINDDGNDLIKFYSFDEIKEDEEEANQYDENKMYVCKSLDSIFEGKNLSNEDQLKVFELLHENYIGIIVAKYLKAFKSPRKLANVSIMKTLSDILKYLITVSIHYKQNDFEVIYSILCCSQFIYTIDETTMRKIFLTNTIKEHGIWQDISKWIFWIYKVIENKRQEFINKKGSHHKSSFDEYDSP